MTRPSSPKLSVLVIDDDPRVADILVQTLEEEGFLGAKEFSGGRGYWEYVTGRHQALLVDEALGRAKGLHLIRLVRLLDQETTLILISGVADLNAAVAALRAGADDFISKPFKSWDLRARVQTALNRRALVARRAGPAPKDFHASKDLEALFSEYPALSREHLLRLLPALETSVLHRPGLAERIARKAREAATRLSVRESLVLALGRAAALQLLGLGGWDPALAREALQGPREWQNAWRSVLQEGADYLEALEGEDGKGAKILESAAALGGGALSPKAGREEEILGILLLLATFFTAAESWEGTKAVEKESRALLEEWGEEAGIQVDPDLAQAFF